MLHDNTFDALELDNTFDESLQTHPLTVSDLPTLDVNAPRVHDVNAQSARAWEESPEKGLHVAFATIKDSSAENDETIESPKHIHASITKDAHNLAIGPGTEATLDADQGRGSETAASPAAKPCVVDHSLSAKRKAEHREVREDRKRGALNRCRPLSGMAVFAVHRPPDKKPSSGE